MTDYDVIVVGGAPGEHCACALAERKTTVRAAWTRGGSNQCVARARVGYLPCLSE